MVEITKLLTKTAFDGRKEKLSFTEKSEKAYTWTDYSAFKSGWLCKVCEKYATSCDRFWKTIPRKHDRQSGQFFRKHMEYAKQEEALRIKKETKKILSKGNVIYHILRAWKQEKRAVDSKSRGSQKIDKNHFLCC